MSIWLYFVLTYIRLGLGFVSFLASLTVYFRKDAPVYLKYFPPFLLLSVLYGVIAHILALKYNNNHIAFNIYTQIAVPFYLLMLRMIIWNKRVKKWILYACCSFTIVSLIVFLFHSIKVGNFYIYTAGALLISTFCAWYIFELMHSNASRYKRIPAFWICCGLLLHYAVTLPLLSAGHIAMHFPAWIIKYMDFFLYSTDYIFHILITIAFLCHLRSRKPVS